MTPRRSKRAKRFAGGPPRAFAPGETIFNVGERHAPAWLVLNGEIEITRRDGLSATRTQIARVMGVGQFTGEMSELSGRGTLAARPRRAGRLHRAAVRPPRNPRADRRLRRARRNR